MRYILIIFLFVALKAGAQIELTNGKIISDVKFKTTEYYYFELNDTIFKIQPQYVTTTSGKILSYPATNYYDEMYSVHRTAQTGFGLMLFGIGLQGIAVIVSQGDDPNPKAVIGLSVAGGALNIIGLFTEVGANKKGKRANLKMGAIEYK